MPIVNKEDPHWFSVTGFPMAVGGHCLTSEQCERMIVCLGFVFLLLFLLREVVVECISDF